jgi:hypothetical protein
MDLPAHIEQYLGRIDYGWKLADATIGFSVIRVLNEPQRGVTAYSTLGMNADVLRMPGSRTVRQELLFAVNHRHDSSQVASFLLTLGQSILSRRCALLRGDVLGPYAALFAGASTSAVYCTVPIMFHPSLATFSGTAPPTVFVWLVPLIIRSLLRKSEWLGEV